MANKYLDKAGLKSFYTKLKNKKLWLTESEITTLITNALNDYKQSIVTIVTTLPTEGVEGLLYMVPSSSDSTVYSIYTWEDSSWKSFGSATVDLTSYYTKTEIDTTLQGYLKTTDMEALTDSEIDEVMS